MRYFVIGGNGLVGRHLCTYLLDQGHEVTALVRHRLKGKDLPPGSKLAVGDPLQGGSWQGQVARHDVLVNLVGRNIMSRWTPKIKRDIYATRIEATRQAVQAIAQASGPRPCLINANAVGYYQTTGSRPVDEDSPPGKGFLAEVCKDWQEMALQAQRHGARVLIARFAAILSANGGALASLLPVFKSGLGGPIASGTQGFPWIHIQDLVRGIEFVAQDSSLSGAVNFSSPGMVDNKEFSQTLAKVLRRPAILPLPGPVLRLALGELAETMVQGPWVRPRRLLESGFQFSFSGLDVALRDLLEP
jgi:hypothetical protein